MDDRVGPRGPGDLRRILRRSVAQGRHFMMASQDSFASRNLRLSGVYTAIVTPFRDDGAVDEAGLRRLAKRQIEGGVAGLVPCGTTGEAVTLDADEHERVVAIVAEEA